MNKKNVKDEVRREADISKMQIHINLSHRRYEKRRSHGGYFLYACVHSTRILECFIEEGLVNKTRKKKMQISICDTAKGEIFSLHILTSANCGCC